MVQRCKLKKIIDSCNKDTSVFLIKVSKNITTVGLYTPMIKMGHGLTQIERIRTDFLLKNLFLSVLSVLIRVLLLFGIKKPTVIIKILNRTNKFFIPN